MDNKYLKDLAEYFADLDVRGLPGAPLRFLRWSLLNYADEAVYSAAKGCCGPLADFYSKGKAGTGPVALWGSGTETVRAEAAPLQASQSEVEASASKVSQPGQGSSASKTSQLEQGSSAPIKQGFLPADAAFMNSAVLSSLELDDSTRGSTHPGSYIWSSALSEYLACGGSTEDIIRAVLFGYDVTTRLAMLGVDKALSMGLHAPGLFGALGAAAGASLLLSRKKTRDEAVSDALNAIGMAASLMPLCPFTAFIEGSDAKDFYGGWGAYIGCMAAEAADAGLTGPKQLLSGVKSLSELFSGSAGSDMPFGGPYMIEFLNVKQFSACFSVNPAVNAVKKLKEEHSFELEDIEKIMLESYPYSVDLDPGRRALNPTSARLSLAYNLAATLMGEDISPDIFVDVDGKLEKYQPLMDRIKVESWEDCGRGDRAARAARLCIILKDGSSLRGEFSAGNVAGGSGSGLNDEYMKARHRRLVSNIMGPEKADALYERIMDLGPDRDLSGIMDLLLAKYS